MASNNSNGTSSKKQAPVKVDIVSGFLGAGKTTFINKLLADGLATEKVALIKNEIGDTDFDSELIEKSDDIEVRSMTSGCICCSLNADFSTGIVDIVKNYSPDRIIVEPTGIAEPSMIANICEKEVWQVDVTVNSITTIVNAANLLEMIDLEIGVYEQQLRESSFFLVNRIDSVDSDELDQIEKSLREYSPEASMVLCNNVKDTDAIEILSLSEEALVHRRAIDGGLPIEEEHVHEHEEEEHEHDDDDDECSDEHHHHHVHDCEAFSIFPTCEFTPNNEEEITSALQGATKGVLLRSKGFLKSTEGGYLLYEYVYGESSMRPCSYDGDPKLIIIGRNIEKSEYENLYE